MVVKARWFSVRVVSRDGKQNRVYPVELRVFPPVYLRDKARSLLQFSA